MAAELRALDPHLQLTVYGLESAMFRGRPRNPAIVGALEELGLQLLPEPPVIHADTIVLHNPACLKADLVLRPRLSAGRILVVTHENFLRPGGREGFDIRHCLDLISGRIAGGEMLLAPVSASNRAGVADWLAQNPDQRWSLAPDDWSNICDQSLIAPTPNPRDRRGRHSRAGFEKFPADRVLASPVSRRMPIAVPSSARTTCCPTRRLFRRTCELLPFGSIKVSEFLASIDFFVYFTHPLWRESFGRAIAEAIAAGKLVITDPITAENFGPGVIGDDGSGIDLIIHEHVVHPTRYAAAVRLAQTGLAAYRPDHVVPRMLAVLDRAKAVDALL